jgi:EpsG family
MRGILNQWPIPAGALMRHLDGISPVSLRTGGAVVSSIATRNLILSLLFASVVAFLPWQLWTAADFSDIDNYVSRVNEIAQLGFNAFELGVTWFDWVKNEYLWFLLLYGITLLNVEPELAFVVLSFFIAFAYHRFLTTLTSDGVTAFILLLNPISIDLFRGQLRSALAVSVFLLAIVMIRRQLIIFIIGAALCFVHTSMMFLLPMYLLSRTFASWSSLSTTSKSCIALIAGVTIGILLASFVTVALQYAEDRRGSYQIATRSPAYLVFWMGWGVLLTALACRAKAVDWWYYLAIVSCLAVTCAEMLGFAGFRFMALLLPLILAAPSTWPQEYRFLPVLVLMSYQVLQFSYWLK